MKKRKREDRKGKEGTGDGRNRGICPPKKSQNGGLIPSATECVCEAWQSVAIKCNAEFTGVGENSPPV